MVRGCADAMTCDPCVTQCADTTHTAFGRGSSAASPRKASVKALCSMAFIGEPCPTNKTGIFSTGSSLNLLGVFASAVLCSPLAPEHYMFDYRGGREDSCARTLFQVCLIRVVVEAEAQRQVRSGEISGQRRKWIRIGNSAPGGAFQPNIAGRSHKTHIGELALFGDSELDRQLAFLHLRRLGNQQVPVLSYFFQNC